MGFRFTDKLASHLHHNCARIFYGFFVKKSERLGVFLAVMHLGALHTLLHHI